MPLFKVQTGSNRISSVRPSLAEWSTSGWIADDPSLYVEAQDAIEALSLVKPDYTTWSEESLKHTGHLTDEDKRSMFDAYLLDWSADVRVTMLSRDNVVYSHWVKELGEIALEKAELDIRLNEQQEANIGIMRNNKELFDQNAGLRREHAQLIEERDKARSQRDEVEYELGQLKRAYDSGKPPANRVSAKKTVGKKSAVAHKHEWVSRHPKDGLQCARCDKIKSSTEISAEMGFTSTSADKSAKRKR